MAVWKKNSHQQNVKKMVQCDQPGPFDGIGSECSKWIQGNGTRFEVENLESKKEKCGRSG
jgi:hypothetical protein